MSYVRILQHWPKILIVVVLLLIIVSALGPVIAGENPEGPSEYVDPQPVGEAVLEMNKPWIVPDR